MTEIIKNNNSGFSGKCEFYGSKSEAVHSRSASVDGSDALNKKPPSNIKPEMQPAASSSMALNNTELPPKKSQRHSFTTRKRPIVPQARCKSDNTVHMHPFGKTLQTIESGISLSGKDGGNISSPRIHNISSPHHSPDNKQNKVYHAPSPPSPLPPLPRKQINAHPTLSNNDSMDYSECPTHRSQFSHYSTDAGKHGMVWYQHDSEDEENSSSGSLVFTYLPGQEIPPAEYALPASILKVYGVDCDGVGSVDVPIEMEGQLMHYRLESDGTNSSLVSVSSHDSKGDEKRSIGKSDENGNKDGNISYHAVDVSPQVQSHAQPPRFYLIPADQVSCTNHYQQRILPYHERKRLMEREDEIERKEAEERELMSKYATKNGYGSFVHGNETSGNQQQLGWFGKITSIFRGQPQELHRRYGSVEDESKLYRDRAQAFLKQTLSERNKIKEQLKLDEMKNVTIPMHGHSLGHSRSKMSSLSNALDSIASCSDDESCSSDEETGSSFTGNEDESDVGNVLGGTKKIKKNNRVWTHGEQKQKHSISSRDKAMQRERLIQEEYEFRLRSLKRENERLAKRFRLFVLVTVSTILIGAITFGFVVCIHMLLS
mmetsp:Transcript_23898/g.48414  ORF Transcript_23898/g.48414 Transcript_23898/m.48414 type:complete len:601 (-) Transcript_23898:141-1943(-)